jgi:hypothetical protein
LCSQQDDVPGRITRNFPTAGFDNRGRRCRGIGHGRAAVIGTSTPAKAANVSQKIVKYQDHPKGEQRCDNCELFEPPSSCKNVDGTIAAQGWRGACSVVKTTHVKYAPNGVEMF